jgi:hypothetical protein
MPKSSGATRRAIMDTRFLNRVTNGLEKTQREADKDIEASAEAFISRARSKVSTERIRTC